MFVLCSDLEMSVKYCDISFLLGENKVPLMSAVRFIKLLFQYKQQEAFAELARDMLQVLSVSSTQVVYVNFHYSEKNLLILICVTCFHFEFNIRVLLSSV